MFSYFSKSFACLALVFFGASQTMAEVVVEAKQDGVKVLQDANKGAAELATLKKGESLAALDRKGIYWRVKTAAGKEGFVSFMAVVRKESAPSALASAINKAAMESRDMDGIKGARSRSAVMGIRGLDETSETSSAGNVQPNLRLVYAMEDRVVSKKRIEKLGELVQAEMTNKMEKVE
jgi:hypothetical protein